MPEWLQKEGSIAEAAQQLKRTVRDTAGHAGKVGAMVGACSGRALPLTRGSTRSCCMRLTLACFSCLQLALLLFLEELQQERDVRMYDIPDATFIEAGRGGRYLVLEVRVPLWYVYCSAGKDACKLGHACTKSPTACPVSLAAS